MFAKIKKKPCSRLWAVVWDAGNDTRVNLDKPIAFAINGIPGR